MRLLIFLLEVFIPACASSNWAFHMIYSAYNLNKKGDNETMLLNHTMILGFLASGGKEFNPGPAMRFVSSEVLCNKALLKYKGDVESY